MAAKVPSQTLPLYQTTAVPATMAQTTMGKGTWGTEVCSGEEGELAVAEGSACGAEDPGWDAVADEEVEGVSEMAPQKMRVTSTPTHMRLVSWLAATPRMRPRTATLNLTEVSMSMGLWSHPHPRRFPSSSLTISSRLVWKSARCSSLARPPLLAREARIFREAPLLAAYWPAESEA